jgi:hypothetical protein
LEAFLTSGATTGATGADTGATTGAVFLATVFLAGELIVILGAEVLTEDISTQRYADYDQFSGLNFYFDAFNFESITTNIPLFFSKSTFFVAWPAEVVQKSEPQGF